MSDSSSCNRCGATLPVERVRVPVYKWITNEVSGKSEKVWDSWDWVDDIGDCVRCTGSY